MKTSCVGMCKDKPTHVHLCNPMRSREKKSRNMPAAGARETQNRLPRKRKHTRSRLAHASNFSFARETLPKEHLSVTRNERQILSLALLSYSASPNIRGSASGKWGGGSGNIPARHQHGQQGARCTPAEYPCITAAKAAVKKPQMRAAEINGCGPRSSAGTIGGVPRGAHVAAASLQCCGHFGGGAAGSACAARALATMLQASRPYWSSAQNGAEDRHAIIQVCVWPNRPSSVA